jgi:hypothetical protein
MLFVPERGDHIFNCPNIGKRYQHHFRHNHLLRDRPKNRMRDAILQVICCLWLIKAAYDFGLLLF